MTHERETATAAAAEPTASERAVTSAAGGQVALVLGLQRTVGNAAVARMVAGRRLLQRSPAGQAVIDRNTDMWGANLNEEKLGEELAGMLPGGALLVNDVFWTLSNSDRDDVAVALVEAVPLDSDLRTKAVGAEWLFRGMVRWLIEGETEDDEARAIDRLTRAWSRTHRRLKAESWNTDPTVTAALTAQGATIQSSSSGWAGGDFIHDEYSIVMESMPPGLTAEAFLQEMATDLNKAVGSTAFDAINTFHRRPLSGSGGPAVGDVYHIDIKGPDNGSVMLVESTSDHFVFQTVATKEDGTHPEYGARQFGFERLGGGAVRFYTRGTSRPGLTPLSGTIGRHAQASGWTALLKGIAASLVARGGTEKAGSFDSWNTHRDDLTASGTRPL